VDVLGETSCSHFFTIDCCSLLTADSTACNPSASAIHADWPQGDHNLPADPAHGSVVLAHMELHRGIRCLRSLGKSSAAAAPDTATTGDPWNLTVLEQEAEATTATDDGGGDSCDVASASAATRDTVRRLQSFGELPATLTWWDDEDGGEQPAPQSRSLDTGAAAAAAGQLEREEETLTWWDDEDGGEQPAPQSQGLDTGAAAAAAGQLEREEEEARAAGAVSMVLCGAAAGGAGARALRRSARKRRRRGDGALGAGVDQGEAGRAGGGRRVAVITPEFLGARRTLSSRPVERVAIVGGTHGNETTAVALAQHLLEQPELLSRPSFEARSVSSGCR
jgi:hypothetical protein